MIRSIEPQEGISMLVPHPHRLTLRGSPADAKFPPLCPSCGGGATSRLECAKVFRRSEPDSGMQYIVKRISVPFCQGCIASHRAQAVQPSLMDTLTASFASMHMLGAVFPALAAAFLVHIAIGDALRGSGTRGLVELGLGAIAALIAWGQGFAVWKQSERLRVPPQTEVTKSFDYSDDTSEVFEPARFICTMRDGTFANAFRLLNIDREWLALSPAAVAERRRSNVLTWIIVAVVLVVVAWNFLHDLFK
jgi:hypothetical protein